MTRNNPVFEKTAKFALLKSNVLATTTKSLDLK